MVGSRGSWPDQSDSNDMIFRRMPKPPDAPVLPASAGREADSKPREEGGKVDATGVPICFYGTVGSVRLTPPPKV